MAPWYVTREGGTLGDYAPDVAGACLHLLGRCRNRDRVEPASLRNRFGSAVTEANVRPHYAALAALCRPEGSGAGVGDLSTTELRRVFGTGPGLILTSAGWRVSRDVRLGRPIFGAHRPFVSDKGPLARLWRILDISLPSVGDCLTVLEEIADTGTEPSLEDRAVIVDTLRYVAQRP